MILMPDVNILVYAHREPEAAHLAYRAWLEQLIGGPQPFSLSVLVATAFVRLVTNPQLYREPTPLPAAIAAIEQLARHPRCRLAMPAGGHLDDVLRLCRVTNTAGRHVSDAQHAALAIAEGATWVTRDAGFRRFEPHGLRWQHLVLE